MRTPSDAPSVPRAAVVGVGDELLLGETVDTNGAWLGRELSRLGFGVVRREVVADVEEEIQGAVGRSLAVSDVVLLTGGLGPTRDDLTREAVAAFFQRPLEVDEDLLQLLRDRFRSMGYPDLPANGARMARVPRGARVLSNVQGAAPALVLEDDRGICVLFPGVPREMRELFRKGAAPLLETRFAQGLRPVFLRTLFTAGIPESLLSREVEELLPEDTGPVSLAFLPDVRGVRIRLTARGLTDREEAEAWFSRVERALAPALDPYRYESETGDLAQALGDRLRAENLTLATAESCTGGLIAQRITDHAGSSGYFLGGVVAYHNEIKEGLLGVPPEILEEKGAVSREVAEALARGVARRFRSRTAMGVTGVAGPGGGTAEKPVGTVWYAASLDDEIQARVERFPGDRRDVRERAAQAAMNLLFRMLEGEGR